MKKFTFIFLLTCYALTFSLKAQVISENFDGSSSIPENWESIVYSTSTYSEIKTSTSNKNSEPNSLYLYASYSDPTAYMILASPVADFSQSSSHKLSAYVYGSVGDKIAIGTISDYTDTSTYIPIDTLEITVGYKFNYFEKYISPAETNTRVAFRRVKGNVYIDDITVDPVLPYNVKIETLNKQDAILSGTGFDYLFLIKNTGTNIANFSFSVDSELTYKILDKDGITEISTKEIAALTNDTIIIKVTSSSIQDGIKQEDFTLKTHIVESTTSEASIEVNFTTYSPYIEIEDGFESQSLPFAWSVSGDKSKVKFFESDYYSHTGTCYTQISAGTTEIPNMLISPALKGYDGDYKISAWINGTEDLEIGIITDLNDWSTYKALSTVTGGNRVYEKIELICKDFNNNAHVVFKFVGINSYSKTLIDDVDFERYEDYSLDLKTENTNQSGYVGGQVLYPIYILNNGTLDEKYDISVDSEWNYKILSKDLLTEITEINVSVDVLDTVYVQMEIPENGILDNQIDYAKVKVACHDNVANFEETELSTTAYFYYSYLNEGFENSTLIPANWKYYAHEAKYSSVKVKTGSSYAYEGQNGISMYQSSSAEYPLCLISPIFNASDNNYSISFNAKVTSGEIDLKFGTITDPNDTTTFELITNVSLTTDYTLFAFDNVTLTEAKAFAIIHGTASKTINIDNVVVKQNKTVVTFDPLDGTEFENSKPDMFVYFSKPVLYIDSTELAQNNITDVLELRKGSESGEVININTVISDNKQSLKIAPTVNLIPDSYYLILNKKLIDFDGDTINSDKISFQILDLVAPEFTEGFPIVENITKDAFDLKVNSNEDGKSYYILVAKGSVAPDYQQVKAGVDYNSETVIVAGNKNILGNTTEILLVEGLDENTEYDLYVTVEDNSGNTQENVVKLDVKTLDVTAPEFVEGFPIVENITKDAFDLKVNSNEDGKSYYILLADGSDAPDYMQVKAGVDYNSETVIVAGNKNILGNTTEIIQVEGLDENTEYDLYVTVEDNNGNTQENVVKLDVKIPDVTAPEFAQDYPQAKNIKETAFDLFVKSNEAGIAYYILIANDAMTPTATEIKNAVNYSVVDIVESGNIDSKTEEEAFVIISGLVHNTEYDLYLTIEDSEGNLQEIISKVDVKTIMSTSIEEFDLNFTVAPNPAKDFININSSEIIKNYTLLNAIGNVVLKNSVKERSVQINVSGLNKGLYFLIVKTNLNKESVKRIVIE
ncbi:MAG: T9SS type A sorting domain-containing protein [Bacteroidales bacterium]|nr:T9SS type A sorting domain-containing protein [Bacteroidales bacterium]